MSDSEDFWQILWNLYNFHTNILSVCQTWLRGKPSRVRINLFSPYSNKDIYKNTKDILMLVKWLGFRGRFYCDTFPRVLWVTSIMWPCHLNHVTMSPQSCDHVTSIMWPCHLNHVTMSPQSCDHVTSIMWPCHLNHVTMSPQSCDHVTSIMWPCRCTRTSKSHSRGISIDRPWMWLSH